MESGLQYVVICEGDEGGEILGLCDCVSVMYDGCLIDGIVFDSFYECGLMLIFGVNQVIFGWIEGLQLMLVGDEFIFYILIEFGYGD